MARQAKKKISEELAKPAPSIEEALKRRRAQRPFPASSFEDTLSFAKTIFQIGGGQPVKRLTLFDQLNKSPESSASRQLIVNAGRYGLTKGGVQAENIELTAEGRKAIDDQFSIREQAKTRAELAIFIIDAFEKLYQRFVGN